VSAPTVGVSTRLAARDITVRRARRPILRDVSCEVTSGAMLGVTGRSGAGKTTLLHVLAGIIPADSGEVLLGEQRVRAGDRGHRLQTGVVPQFFGLLPALTAEENVQVALLARGVGGQEAERRARAALDEVGLAGAARRLVEQLSGGQQQRVAVARAVVGRPALLLADEPTSELDPATRDLVVQLLRDMAGAGAAVVLATHDPDVAAACDHTLELDDGVVVA
jgi:putative ABC transport system ATP-binding protein